MKKLTYLLIALLLAGSVQAQGEVEAKSKIDAVTVFLQGAQVTRSAEVTLKKGKNVVYFRRLGEGIQPQSIQASAPQAFLINSVIHETNYLDQQVETPRVKLLQDSLEIIQRLTEDNQLAYGVLENEKNMIVRNQSLASEEQGLNVDELARAAEFFRSRLTEIYDKQLGHTRSNARLALRRSAIGKQLQELNARRGRPSQDIRVIVDSPDATVATVGITYFVTGAGWVPGYNIRAKDTQSPMVLEYKADVFQNTGVDWSDVKLTLSSGNPNMGGTQPVLNPWNLYVQEEIVYRNRSSAAAGAPAPAYKTMEAEEVAANSDTERETLEEDEVTTLGAGDAYSYGWQPAGLSNYTELQEGATTAEFRISIVQTIPSNGKSTQVTVRTAELPAQYRHFAVPKLDKDAFLVAGLTGWDTLNLLPGLAQIFFEGTYVTEVSIDPAYTSDTLDLSLGRDKKVVIERTQLQDFNKVRFIGLNRERTFAYTIKVRNTKESPVSLNLEDQIPVSQDKEIEVKLVESSGAKLNAETGKLEWELNLGKAETKEIRLIYTVKYPKNKYVPGI